MLCHTFPTLHRINCQGTCYSKYSICKIFWRYTNSKKDMDIDMIWYNILMVFWDRGHDIISQQLARYEIWYYILEFGIFPTTALCSIVRILLLFNKTWKESHQAKKVKCIGKFFPESNTNVKFWQMPMKILKNILPKFQCLQWPTTILLQCLI